MKMIAWISFIIISSFEIGDARSTSKIVGGKRIEITNSPYYASVRYAAHDVCGASIISTSYLLTSASCIMLDIEPIAILANLQVVTGSSSRFANSSHINDISFVIFHLDYSPKEFWKNDIALLKLKLPIVKSSIRSIIDIPPYYLRASQRVAIVGWEDWISAPSDSYLHFIEMIIEHQSICKKVFKEYSLSSAITYACASKVKPNEAITLGDSGSGIVYFTTAVDKIIGIISVQIQAKQMIRFTKVRCYISWINELTLSF